MKNATTSNAKNTNATANTEKQSATVTTISQVKKIDRAREVYKTVTAEGYVAPEGSSPRAEFIKVCLNDLKMTDSGASTYWQMLNKEAQGGQLYAYTKAPTGAPRGRRPDANREIKKAAARLHKARDRMEKDAKELDEATQHFTQLVTQATQ